VNTRWKKVVDYLQTATAMSRTSERTKINASKRWNSGQTIRGNSPTTFTSLSLQTTGAPLQKIHQSHKMQQLDKASNSTFSDFSAQNSLAFGGHPSSENNLIDSAETKKNGTLTKKLLILIADCSLQII
jgi:hypothetical protein